jgi:hypothetical protein
MLQETKKVRGEGFTTCARSVARGWRVFCENMRRDAERSLTKACAGAWLDMAGIAVVLNRGLYRRQTSRLSRSRRRRWAKTQSSSRELCNEAYARLRGQLTPYTKTRLCTRPVRLILRTTGTATPRIVCGSKATFKHVTSQILAGDVS